MNRPNYDAVAVKLAREERKLSISRREHEQTLEITESDRDPS